MAFKEAFIKAVWYKLSFVGIIGFLWVEEIEWMHYKEIAIFIRADMSICTLSFLEQSVPRTMPNILKACKMLN